jgi:hypothetical protein
MKVKVVLEDGGVGEMVPKHKLLKNVSLHDQELNYGKNICELEDHVGEKGLSLNWPTKFGLAKKNSCKFSLSLPYQVLESNPHFLMPCCPTMKR